MNENEGHVDNFTEEDDDQQNSRSEENENEEEIENRSSDQVPVPVPVHVHVPPSVHQPEAMTDAIVGGRGSVCGELQQSSAVVRENIANQRRQRIPFSSDSTSNTRNIGSSSRPTEDDQTGGYGTIHSHRNVLGQNQSRSLNQGQITGATQPVLHSGSSTFMGYDRNLGIPAVQRGCHHQHGIIHSQRNVLSQNQGQSRNQGHLTDGTHPVLHSGSSTFEGYDLNFEITFVQTVRLLQPGVIPSQRNALGQNQGQIQNQGQVTDGTQPVLHSGSSTFTDYDRNTGIPVRQRGGHHRHGIIHSQRNVSSQETDPTMFMNYDRSFGNPRSSYNQMLPTSQYLGNINVAPTVTSGFFIPDSVHQHNMRMWSDSNMVRGPVVRQGPPTIQMGTLMPRYIATPVNPALPMPRSNTRETITGMIANTNEQNVRIGESSDSMSHHDGTGSDNVRNQDQEDEREHGSTSRESKRAKR